METSGEKPTFDCNEPAPRFARSLPGRRRIVSVLAAGVTLATLCSAQPLERESWKTFQQRRRTVVAKAAGGVVALFGLAAAEGRLGRGPFRQESNFYYLTGCNQPGAALLIEPGRGHRPYRETLYLPARRFDDKLWDGPGANPGARDSLSWSGFVRVRPASKFRADLARAAGDSAAGDSAAGDSRPVYTLGPRSSNGFAGGAEPDSPARVQEALPGAEIVDIRREIARLRAVKTKAELRLIEKAVEASVAAHLAAWRRLRPGVFEHELFAPMSQALIDGGCARPAYPPIIGSGPNSVVLHYSRMARRARAGELVLMDVGGEFSGYAADLTRTLPVSGRFTKRQRRVYEWVLGAQQAVIDAVRPGMTLTGSGPNSLQTIAERYFDERKSGLSRRFPHGVGHHVGLDVHDPAPNRPLEPGMVITVEPGLYFPGENLGVRIEDMLLVTADGARLLSAKLPKTLDEIERLPPP